MNLDSNAQENLYFNHWKKLEDIFVEKDNNQFVDFFRYFLSIKKYELANADDVYSTFVDWWENAISNGSDRAKILDEIYNYSVCFKELYYEDNIPSGLTIKNKEIFSDFHLISSYTIAPFIVEMYYLYKYKGLPENTFFKIMNLLNKYIIRREFAGMKINDASRFFPQLLKSVNKYAGSDYSKTYDITLKYLVNINKNNLLGIPTNIQISENLKTCNAYKLPHIKLALIRMENLGSTVPLQYSDSLSIEHILPQTYNDYWKNVVGLEELVNYQYHCNKFGNLTLVSVPDNSGMKNKDFEHKKSYLIESRHIRLNEYVINKDEWNLKEIESRHPITCDLFFREFEYEEAPIDISAEYSINYNKKNVSCVATINYYGEIVVNESTMLGYKVNGAATNSVVYINARDNGQLQFDSNGNIILKAGSRFKSLKTLSDLLVGKDDKYLSSWRDDDNKAFEDSILYLIDYKEN